MTVYAARMVDDGAARDLCGSLLAVELPRRWAHSAGVARHAHALGGQLPEHAELVIAAAWLHDIGYAAPLLDTGFHPIDGARHLREAGFGDRRLWTLVAHHSCAVVEAEERGLDYVLTAEFPVDGTEPAALAALTYCDMTTDPDGEPVGVDERIGEILARYGPGDVVHRAVSRAAPTLRRQVAEVRALLGTG
ncbi:MAG: HD domain-containing protein [Pseudonocardia sp.]